MEGTQLFLLVSTLSLVLILTRVFRPRSDKRQTPPSPSWLRIFHHIFWQRNTVTETFTRLADRYGPIISFSVGSVDLVVVSSPELVHECFTKNDVVLADRPGGSAILRVDGQPIVATASYGPLWRNLRRLAAQEFLSPSRLTAYKQVREDELRSWLKTIFTTGASHTCSKVEMRSKFSDLLFNTLMMMIVGRRDFGEDSTGAGNKFLRNLHVITEMLSSINSLDFFSYLCPTLLKTLEKKVKMIQVEMDEVLQEFLTEHKRNRSLSLAQPRQDSMANPLVDTMLDLQDAQPDDYSDETVKGMILTLIVAGTDTVSLTLEWAFTHILNNPDSLKKARAEIDAQVGTNRLVQEQDLPNLPYTQCILHETLRYTPTGPFLVPHMSSDRCTIGGYEVAKGTVLLVNAWAIHRDPRLWASPRTFLPERFRGEEDVAQSHNSCKWVAFGLGRRKCPGEAIAYKIMGLTLAALIQCFEWDRVGENSVDLRATEGLLRAKMNPLEAMCRARVGMKELLQTLE
uniref:Cytochrome P450 n=1 Tax=Kalanchoe fedtschenkoi TaxID=63787 RepID=A0A7N0SXI5_KALFE